MKNITITKSLFLETKKCRMVCKDVNIVKTSSTLQALVSSYTYINWFLTKISARIFSKLIWKIFLHYTMFILSLNSITILDLAWRTHNSASNGISMVASAERLLQCNINTCFRQIKCFKTSPTSTNTQIQILNIVNKLWDGFFSETKVKFVKTITLSGANYFNLLLRYSYGNQV